MSVLVSNVIKGSYADKKRIKSGDIIYTINGNSIEDVLDYRFYMGEKKLIITFERDGKMKKAVIKKPEDAEIGLEFDTYLMDKQRSCKNKCIFCFIDQMPKGMRDTLYFKDDDSRMSFLFGNYITLTNITEHEVDRIIKMHISPINISVHTTNPELRVEMMKNKWAGDSLKILYKLAEAGVKINCQLVLCPGINDGDELKRSISDLTALYPAVASIACVPVGLTKFRESLPHLDGYTAQTAASTLEIIEKMGDECVAKYGERLVFASDEFYIKSGKKLPKSDYYGDFDQLDNGVGLCALLEDEFDRAIQMTDEGDYSSNCTIATGVAAAPILSSLVDKTKEKWHNIDCKVVPIVNDYFGHEITVAGLLTATDIIKQLKDKPLGDRLLLPTAMFRSEGDITLDDYTAEDIEKALGVQVIKVSNDGFELLNALLNI